MINSNELNSIAENLIEFIIFFTETAASGKQDEFIFQHLLITRVASELLSYSMLFAGDKHIDAVSEAVFKEIVSNAKRLLHEDV